ncbi:hypothetical protein N8I77_008508 [Diaporthe amygdali]|uniref:Alternative oxidase n=1 Tax=Phomopsis amygdali TaxID=1214568 RepID=A0AAD9SDY8_PHOAM|nr:hypothetical protein N8I77_008508 [Diaporthe amygdali]
MFTSLSRQGKVLLLVCTISLVTIWTCRLPQLCIFDQRPHTTAAITSCPSSHAHHEQSGSSFDVDLSAPDAPFVSWPLARVCSENKRWTPGLVFICDNNSGGIGNIRNFILTCLRYAIESGATGLTLPTIQTRSEAKLADLFVGKKLPFAYFFDEAHFRAGLSEACPQITIYGGGLGDVPGLDAEELSAGRVKPDQITPNHFGRRGGCDARDLNRHGGLFGEQFHVFLRERQEQLGLGPVSASSPKLVRMNWGVQWNWPVMQDGPEFTASFGGLLRFRDDILALGGRTADAMDKLAAGRGFVGIHLRTENDALGAWPTFENQTAAYLAKIAGLGPPPPEYAYLATGNATEAARLAARALAQQGLRVVTKHELLRLADDGDELLRQLDALSWDQQALVDFVVLLRCGYFLGVSPSSFSMNVALKRHLRADGLYTRPWRIGSSDGDGRSWLVGRYDNYWEDWLFMYDSLWP